MEVDYYIGIDPGQTGGIVALDRSGAIATMAKFDASNPLEVIKEAISDLGVGVLSVALEKVGARPGQCVSSMFRFGEGYGAIQGFFYGIGVGVELYAPQEWQKYLPGAQGASDPKSRVLGLLSKRGVTEVFIGPGCRVPHQGCADSFGIAVYHRDVMLGSVVRAKPRTEKVKKSRRAMRF